MPVSGGMLIGYRSGTLVSIRTLFKKDTMEGKVLLTSPINCIHKDSTGRFWVGTPSGVKVFQYFFSQQQYADITERFPDLLKLHAAVFSIAEDAEKNLYFGTFDGLFIYSVLSADANGPAHYTTRNSTLTSDCVKKVYIDRSNKLWVNLQHEKLYKVDLSQKKVYFFRLYDYDTPKNKVFIQHVFEDSRKRLWIGTANDGLFCYDKVSGRRFYRSVNSFKNSACAKINKVFEDRYGNIWFCSCSGLSYLPHNKPFTSATRFVGIKDETLNSGTIQAMVEDEYGNYWLRIDDTLYKIKIDLKSNTVSSKTAYYTAESGRGRLLDILCTKKNTIWMATFRDGLYRITYNNQNDSIRTVKYSPLCRHTFFISGKTVLGMLCYNDSLWVGTDNGLNLYTRDNEGQFAYKKTFSVSDGLPSNMMTGYLMNDKNGNLWIDTDRGISKLLASRHAFVNFYYIMQTEGRSCGTCPAPFETVYFGTVQGLIYFDPLDIKPDRFSPRTVITNLLIHNDVVHPGEKINGQVVLNKTISYTSEVFLSHKNNNFSLQFSAFNYVLPEADRYSYILEGYDKKWMNTHNHGNAVFYSNLPAGEYLFKVMGVNSDGVADV